MINVQEREKAHQSARIGILFATFEARSRAKMKTTKIIKMLSTGLALASIDQGPPAITPLGSYPLGSGSPARIATDSQGRVYATDPDYKKVFIYSNNGVLLKTMSVAGTPLGIAVDGSGKIYIGDASNGNVGVYDREGELLFKLGGGDGEFGLPNAIAVANDGSIYVIDSASNAVIRFFTSREDEDDDEGNDEDDFISAKRVFGQDLLSFPTDIAIDETAGHAYVLDHNNKYIRIFDRDGNHLGSVDISGSHLKPLGLAIDGSWMFKTDAYHSLLSVHEYDGTGGTYTFIKTAGSYGSGSGEYKTPTGIAADKDGKLFVANTNNNRIEVLGVDSFVGLQVLPHTIIFSAFSNGSSVTQSVDITSTGNETDWTATESSSWLSLSAFAGSTPASVNVSVNPAMAVGNYSAEVLFTTPSGTEAVLLVHLKVNELRPTFTVAPSVLNLVYAGGSDVLPSGELFVSSSGPAADWNATTTSGWLLLDKTAGGMPDTIPVSATDSIKSFAPGNYNAEVVVDSNTATGGPKTVTVSLTVLEAGAIKVTTNLDEAGFTITGPEGFSGTGTTWSAVDVIPGEYTISFAHVSGFTKPPMRSFTVEPGQTAEINAVYTEKPAPTHIIAGLGNGNSHTVAVYTIDGVLEFTFTPDFSYESAGENNDEDSDRRATSSYNLNVAAGDMDGDGVDEIIVTNGSDAFIVYDATGTEIASYSFSGKVSDLDIEVIDVDDDGKAEVLAGYHDDSRYKTMVQSFALTGNLIQDNGVVLSQTGRQAFKLAAGDINGDGAVELVMTRRYVMNAYQVYKDGTSLLWSRTLLQKDLMATATGDINGDAVDEICVALRTGTAGNDSDDDDENSPDVTDASLVSCLNGDGTDSGFEINAFGDYPGTYAASITLGDIDGDGFDEFGVGAGADSYNESLMKLLESNGQYMNMISAADSSYGVNVSFGRLLNNE
jgi:hypothetical protein